MGPLLVVQKRVIFYGTGKVFIKMVFCLLCFGVRIKKFSPFKIKYFIFSCLYRNSKEKSALTLTGPTPSQT
jgi:hypothetical protein